MADKEGAEKACANPNPMIDGRKANVNLAYLGAKPKLHSSQPGIIKILSGNLVLQYSSLSLADIKLLIGTSRSEPHTSDVNRDFLFI